MKCRFCEAELERVFIDLGTTPVANDFLTTEQLALPEKKYPLKVMVCTQCFLVQVAEFKKATDIFNSEYAYFSSYSSDWLRHAEQYAERMTDELSLGKNSQVIEIASNDGYLLQFFLKKGIPVLGIEPTSNTANAAMKKGIKTIVDYFHSATARKLSASGFAADLLVGNNVLAHVPDVNDFVSALKLMLKKGGTITVEFPHLHQLISQCQFDTIYHEHFSYFSFYTARRIFQKHGLRITNVEELTTHGGSLRLFARHEEENNQINSAVELLEDRELNAGVRQESYYKELPKRAEKIKEELLKFVNQKKMEGKKLAAYGAAAKGNTLLNFCGITSDQIDFIADRNPFKQGRFAPGSRIPVVAEEKITEQKPDYILLLPWNLKDELCRQLSYVKSWGGKLFIPIPELQFF